MISLGLVICCCFLSAAGRGSGTVPNVDLQISQSDSPEKWYTLRLLVILTILALAPAI